MPYTSRSPPLLHSHIWTRSSLLWFLPALQFFSMHSTLSNWFQMCSPLPGAFSLPPLLAVEAGLFFPFEVSELMQAGGLSYWPLKWVLKGPVSVLHKWSCLTGPWDLSILQVPAQSSTSAQLSSLFPARQKRGWKGSLMPKAIFRILPRRALDIQRDLEESITDSCVTQ